MRVDAMLLYLGEWHALDNCRSVLGSVIRSCTHSVQFMTIKILIDLSREGRRRPMRCDAMRGSSVCD